MKKVLIYLLLLANLGTGLAFALDVHPEAAVSHSSVTMDLSMDIDHEPDGDRHQTDHSCHGAAHLTGLIFNGSMPFIASSHDNVMALSQVPFPLYIAPLLRPPIT